MCEGKVPRPPFNIMVTLKVVGMRVLHQSSFYDVQTNRGQRTLPPYFQDGSQLLARSQYCIMCEGKVPRPPFNIMVYLKVVGMRVLHQSSLYDVQIYRGQRTLPPYFQDGSLLLGVSIAS